MGQYEGTKLAKLVVEDKVGCQRWVRKSLKKYASATEEELVRAVYNKLPKFAKLPKYKKYRAEMVFKLTSQLLARPDLERKGIKSQDTLEGVRRFLRSEVGQEWMEDWFQPDTSEIDTSTSDPSMRLTSNGTEKPHIPFTMPDQSLSGTESISFQPRLPRGDIESNNAALSPEGSARPARLLISGSPVAPEPSTIQLDSGTKSLGIHRGTHGAGARFPFMIPLGVVKNELMLVLKCIFICSIMIVLYETKLK